jgi:hypothetical protein
LVLGWVVWLRRGLATLLFAVVVWVRLLARLLAEWLLVVPVWMCQFGFVVLGLVCLLALGMFPGAGLLFAVLGLLWFLV